jgi:hypothetical protein
MLQQVIGGALRQKGLLLHAVFHADNDKDRSKPLSVVIGHGNCAIGLFESRDWKAALDIALEKLEVVKLLKHSQLGWYDPIEQILKIDHPAPSQEPFKPVLDLIREWGAME